MNLALMLNQKLTFRICKVFNKNKIIFLDNDDFVNKNESYNLGFFIGKVFINSNLVLENLTFKNMSK